jgi:hypothetical protein
VFWIWKSIVSDRSDGSLKGAADALEMAGLLCDGGARLTGDFPVPDLAPAGIPHEALADNIGLGRVTAPIVSPRLRQLLHDLAVDNVQYFRCRTRDRADPHRDLGYAIVNVIGRLGLLDRDASRLETDEVDTTVIEFVDLLVLREDAASTLDLFRLAELPKLIVASDRLRQACAAGSMTGVQFLPIAEYSG